MHEHSAYSRDYYKVLTELSTNYSAVMHYYLNFGFSSKPIKYSYSLLEIADVGLQLWKHQGLTNIALQAHDYRTDIATEILARNHKQQIMLQVDQLILCNGSMIIELFKLDTIQKLLANKITKKRFVRLTNFSVYTKNLRQVYFDKKEVFNTELQVMWFQLLHKNGKKVIHSLSKYSKKIYPFRHKLIGALKDISILTKIIWSKKKIVAFSLITKAISIETLNNQLFSINQCEYFSMLKKPKERFQLVLK